MRVIVSLLFGFMSGIIVGGYLQSTRINPVEPITEQIVLTIPKTQQESEKQLLYMAASKAMLEEIHRQKVLKDNEQKPSKR